ncbi:MAG TPA: phosphotransferase family protein [Acidimicrobiales bacterium]|nr:phosphotransferase family protein [Acidimicrobiales bacterium]
MTVPMAANPLGFVTPKKIQHRDLEHTRTALAGWMAGRLPGVAELDLSPLVVPEGNGVANETVVFTARYTDTGGRRSRRFVARLESSQPLFTGTSLADHVDMATLLATQPGVPVPGVVGLEEDPSVLGAPFFVMEHVSGLVPSDRPHWSEAGWLADASPADRRRLWESAVTVMAGIHQVDAALAPFLQRPGDGRSGLEQGLTHWSRYYSWAAGGRSHPVMEAGLEWLEANLPAAPVTGLAWGDARIANMIFRGFRCVAVLDWDMVSLAGPESDLGWWIIQDHGAPRHLDGMGTPRETVELWEAVSGRPADDLHFSLVFNTFRLGAIRMRLARQLAAEDRLPPEMAGLETNNVAIQQLALLLDLDPPGPLTATLPGLD